MSVIQILKRCDELNVRLELVGNNLKLVGNKALLTSEFIDYITQNKQDLLRYLSTEQQVDLTVKKITLSNAQLRLWAIQELEGRSSQYNMPALFEVDGKLNPEILRETITRILMRHSPLRTIICDNDGLAEAKLLDEPDCLLQVIDLQDCESQEQENKLKKIINTELNYIFNISKDVLLRGCLIELSDSKQFLVFLLHHIAFDDASIGIFMDELTICYEALEAGDNPLLPSLEITYNEYASREKHKITDGFYEPMLAYWEKQLADAPVGHNLPIKTRNNSHHSSAKCQSRSLSPALFEPFESIARDQSATPFMAYFSIFSLVVSRVSSSSNVVIGIPVAGRTEHDLSSLIGLFVNSLPVRISSETRPESFVDYLKICREQLIGALSHQEVPFDLIVDRVNPERSVTQSPLFQIMFSMGENDLTKLKLADKVLTAIRPNEQLTAKFDINVDIVKTKTSVEFLLEYKNDLFEDSFINHLLDCLVEVIKQVVNSPAILFHNIKLCTENNADAASILTGNKSQPIDFFKCFSQQVEMFANKVAIKDHQREVTYLELNELSDALALNLQAWGTKTEEFIPVTGTRNCDFIIAILGIMKAGCTYLPISNGLPIERKKQLLNLQNARYLLYTGIEKQQADDLVSTQQGCTSISIKQACTNHSGQFSVNQFSPKQLVYCVFTSGSTGVPKGAMIEHQGFDSHNSNLVRQMELSSKDVIAQTADVSFDIHVWQMLTPLTVGAEVNILHDDLVTDPEILYQSLVERKISVLQIVPSLLTLLTDQRCHHDLPPQLRYICSTGEALSTKLAHKVTQTFPNIPLLNAYGPAECSDDVTWQQIESMPANARQSIPIGGSVDNVQVYLLDEYLLPVIKGAEGEIYIGGSQVGRGYFGEPAKTAEKFIPDPFSGNGQRLYRTGDIGKIDQQGDLIYLGRIDFQVKINGQRVELGEIESAIDKIKNIESSIVTLTPSSNHSKILTAYFISKQKLSSENIEAELILKLPAHMVPRAYVQLDAWPLSANGKIDRKRLPAISQTKKQQTIVAPVNELERLILNIWVRLLKNDLLGTNSNFFYLGGDSILGIQVAGQLRREGWIISLRDIYQYQTVAGLANVARPVEQKISQVANVGKLPLSPIQLDFFNQETVQVDEYNQSVLLSSPAGISSGFWADFINALVIKNDILRLVFSEINNKWQAEFTEWNEKKSQDALTVYPDASVDYITQLHQELNEGLSLKEGELFHFAYIDGNNSKLLMVFHHLVIDGVSWRILLHDLNAAYKQYQTQQPINIGSKSNSFYDWSMHLSEVVKTSQLDEELKYWQSLCYQKSLSLPTDLESDIQLVDSTDKIIKTINEFDTTQLLVCGSKAFGADINGSLLSILAIAIEKIWKLDSINVDMESHGRYPYTENMDLSQTIGWFTAVYPVVVSVVQGDFSSCIINTKENFGKITRGGVSFSVLKQLSHNFPETELLRSDIEFNYLGEFDDSSTGELAFGLKHIEYDSFEGKKRKRRYKLGINCLVINKQMQINIDYSRDQYHQNTIENLASTFVSTIQEFIKLCNRQTQRTYTPVDFPMVNVSFNDLQQWQTQYGDLTAIYPCTPMQQGMIFHSMMDEDDQTYNSVTHLQLSGELNESKFQQAWQILIQRHEIFRTRFTGFERDVFLQVVTPEMPLSWLAEDWRDLTQERKQQQLQQYKLDEKKYRFELSQGPLMHFAIFQVSDDGYELIWSYNHSILDGWCLPLVFEQVMSAYKELLNDKTVSSVCGEHYQQYVEWLQNQDESATLNYWKKSLDNVELPCSFEAKERVEIENQSQKYSRKETTLSGKQLEQLQQFARENHCTMSTLIQLAWGYLLHQYSGKNDVVFGVTVAGRPTEIADIENTIGLFINTVPLSIHFEEQQSMAALLFDLTNNIQLANNNSFVSLNKIQQAVNDGHPIFDSLVVYENYPLDSNMMDNICPKQLNFNSIIVEEESNYPLTLIAIPGESMKLELVFQQQYAQTMALQLLEGVKQVLLSMISSECTLVNQLSSLSSEQYHQLIHQWNQTSLPVEQNVGLHQLFERQVDIFPETIALVTSTEKLTYLQLEQAANRLSHRLLSCNIHQGDLVPVCLPRTADMIISVLAILKVGAAYIPIDLSIPTSRKANIIKQTKSRLIITTEKVANELTDLSVEALLVDHHTQTQWPDTRLDIDISGKEIAYIIFTSGSTGQPKGVILQHDPVVNLIHWVNKSYDISINDRILCVASLSFDLSVYDIFGALAAGSSFYLANEEEISDPKMLIDIIEQHNITFWDSAPAALNQLTAFMPDKGSNKLRLVFLSGDWIPLSLPPKLMLVYPNVQVVGLGGATEAAIWSNFYNIKQMNPDWRSIPYGLPITNAHYHILDKDLRPRPVGVIGDLYIGSQCLSLGYFNQPSLTSTSYIPDPFTTEFGTRLYSTGDLARRMRDGNIEFIGRADNQVKLRGYRIELSEIDTVIQKSDEVRESVSIIREDQIGVRKLVSYVQFEQVGVADWEKLRGSLKRLLPDYMIPAAFVEIISWPTTSNGKMDRQKLPLPMFEVNDKYIAPIGKLEQDIAQLYGELLGQEKVGRLDNFFELGGDSIVSIQLVTRARRLGYDLSPRDIFHAATVEELATRVSESTGKNVFHQHSSGIALITPIQHWMLDKEFLYHDQFTQALRLKTHRPIRVDLMQQALQLVCNYHDALRLSFTMNEDEKKSEILDQEKVEPVKVTYMDVVDEEAADQLADKLHRDLKLSDAKTVAAAIFNYDDQQELLLVVHHWNIDGVSWRFILEDLEMAYTALENGQTPQFDPKTASWIQWSQSIKQLAGTDLIQKQSDYWLKQINKKSVNLANKNDNLELVITVSTQRSLAQTFELSTTEKLLKNVSSKLSATMEELLLFCLSSAVLDGREGGIMIDIENHGRLQLDSLPDVSRTVGWFTSIYPIHFQLTVPNDLATGIADIKDAVRAVPTEGIGFGLLKYLDQKPELQNTATSQLTFNYLGQFDNALNQSSLFGFSEAHVGEPMAPDDKLLYNLEVSAMIKNGMLTVEWNYSDLCFEHKQILHWQQMFERAIEELVLEHEKLKPLLTSADFSFANASREDLALLSAKYKKIDDIYDLTPMQQGLMYHSIIASDGASYIGQYLFEIEGNIDFNAFRLAWKQVVERHSNLHSHFVMLENGHYQIVMAVPEINWSELDWSEFSNEQSKQKLLDWQKQERETPFDLEHQPAIRFTIIKNSEKHCSFNVSFHHVILDGWSLALLNQEVALCYKSYRDNELLNTQPVAPVTDYLAWLKQQDQKIALTYWNKLLGDFDEPTYLPEWRSTDKTQNEEPVVVCLSQENTDKLQQAAKEQGLTLNTLVQGAWALVLSYFSGYQDVVYGVTVSGRPSTLDNHEKIIGLFINTLPMRLNTGQNLLLSDWLQQIQKQQAQSSLYEFTPLVEVQKQTSLEPNQPLFDNYVVFENFPEDPELVKKATNLTIKNKTAYFRGSYALAVQVNPGEKLEFKGIFNSEKLNSESVTEYLEQMKRVLEIMLSNMQTTLVNLPLSKTQRHKTKTDIAQYASNDWIRMFEKQALENPDYLAVSCGDVHLNYHELNSLANKLSHYLQPMLTKKEARVAILIERSCDIITAMLAINKAGACFVPLNSLTKQEVLARTFEKCKPDIIITEMKYMDAAESAGCPVFALDSEPQFWHMMSDENPLTVIEPHQLAYIIFTSGSTGTPKGVMIEHAQIHAYLNSATSRLGFTPKMRHAHVLPFSSDGGYTMIFPVLTSAGELHIVEENKQLDPIYIRNLFKQKQIESLKIAPSYLEAIFTDDDMSGAPTKCLCMGMETLHWALYERLQKSYPELKIFNHYGPTETTVGVITHEINPTDRTLQKTCTSVPLGHEFPHVEIYILDPQLRIVHQGYSGEIYISGRSLGRGYLNSPALTAKNYLPDPFSFKAGMRMYKTGDLARQLDNGMIEFLGRTGQQVKIRGNRVELEGIDAVLKAYQNMKSSVTLLQKFNGYEQLVSYLVVDGQQPASEDIKYWLAERLESYMVPSHIVFMDVLPINNSGKLDRKSLPIPEQVSLDSKKAANSALADSSEMSNTLQELIFIWGEVLGRDDISANDNFYAMGGDSIKGIMVVAKANKLGYILSPQHLFEFQTLQELANYLDDQRKAQVIDDLLPIWREVLGSNIITENDNFFAHGGDSIKGIMVVAKASKSGYQITPQQLFEYHSLADLAKVLKKTEEKVIAVSSEGELPLLPAQRRFFQQKRHNYNNFVQTILLDVATEVRDEDIQQSIEQLISRHSSLRTRFSQPGQQWKAKVISATDIEQIIFTSHSLAQKPDNTWLTELASKEADNINLERDQLMCWNYISWPEGCYLLCQIHHLLVDGISWFILVNELSALLQKQSLSITQDNLIGWMQQLQIYANEIPQMTIDKYIDRLSNEGYLTNLPEEDYCKDEQIIHSTISTELTQSILGTSNLIYKTDPQILLLSAMSMAMRDILKLDKVQVMLEHQGRSFEFGKINNNLLVGWFTNAYPVMLKTSSNHGDVIKSVKESIRSTADTARDYPLLRYLRSDLDLDWQKYQPQILFHYLDTGSNTNKQDDLISFSEQQINPVEQDEEYRPYNLIINAMVINGTLNVSWSFNQHQFNQQQMKILTLTFENYCLQIVEHCQNAELQATPSDFEHIDIDQKRLDKLMNRFKSTKV